MSKRTIRSKKKSSKSANYIQLTTADDFLSQGTQEEESGDRFTLSDLAKSLRFYQKAFEYYLQAKDIADNQQILLDSVYNSSRLLFHVYNQFENDDNINFEVDVPNIQNVVDSDFSIFKSLSEIASVHEEAISICESHNTFLWDLYYNTCLVYSELVENSTESEVSVEKFEQYVKRGLTLLATTLEYQVGELQKLVSESHNEIEDEHEHEHQSHEEGKEDDDDEEEYSSQDAIVPATVSETIISCYSFIQAIYEDFNLNNSYQEGFRPVLRHEINDFAHKVELIHSELVGQFYQGNKVSKTESEPSMLEPLSQNEILQVEMLKASVAGLQAPNLDTLINLWNNKLQEVGALTIAEEAELLPEKYTIIADNFQNFYDRNNTNGIVNLSPNEHWKLLQMITNYFKKSQDITSYLLKEAQTSSKLNPNDTIILSPLISQLVEIINSRVDVDVIRIYHPQWQEVEIPRNLEILEKNVKINLSNNLKYLSINCGLRESIFDKLARRSRKVQVLARQYLLGNKKDMKIFPNERDILKSEIEKLKEGDIYSIVNGN